MADIAAIFHWPLSELERLSYPELIDWQALAVDRFIKMNPSKEQ